MMSNFPEMIARSVRVRELVLLASLSLIGSVGCRQSAPPTPPVPPASNGTESGQAAATIPVSINVKEGFDGDLLHYTDQGSGFFPLSIVRALEDSKTGKPFLEDLERFGLLPGEKSERNPEGFPVGIVTNEIDLAGKKVEMFGFTCAACHTSDIYYQGKAVRVEGGSGLFYVDQLGDAIADSIQATLDKPEKALAFLA